MSTALKAGEKTRAYELTGDFGIDALSVNEKPVPALKANQVKVRVKAVSLNFRDLLVVKGLYNRKLPMPMVPVSDGAGEVVEVGENVTSVKVGDKVAACFMQRWLAGPVDGDGASSTLGGAINGMLAEYVVLSEEGLVHYPKSLSYEEAASLPCAAVTAWNALISTGQIKAGDTVLTMGTGGVSLFALQFAKLSGARVIITSSSDEKLERAKKLGADETINYKSNPDWEKQVLALTGGVGVDHVIELGGAGTLSKSLKAVRLGGYISLIGVLSGGEGTVNPMPVLMKNIRLQGIYVGSRKMFEDMNVAIDQHKLKPVLDKTFQFDEVKEALKYMETGSHFGKITVRVDK